MKINIALRAAGALLTCLILPAAAQAQYPDKPITLYVAFAAGATTDLTARALAQGAEKILGVPIAVENKGGGGATVANGLLASKKPDGYSLLVTSTGSITVRPLLMKLAYTPKEPATKVRKPEPGSCMVPSSRSSPPYIAAQPKRSQKRPPVLSAFI